MDQDTYEYELYAYNSSIIYDDSYNYADDYLYDQVSRVISDFLILYISPVLIISCLCGNILTFVVMCKLASKAAPTIMYLAILTVLDTLVLCNGSGNTWILHLTGNNLLQVLQLQSELSCKVYSFLNSVVFHLDSWCFLVFLIEMTMFTRHPSRAHKICTRERTKHSGLFLLLVITCINGHFFFTYSIVAPNMGLSAEWMCTFSPSMDKASEAFRDYIWPIGDALLTSVLPIIVIVSCMISWISSRKTKESLTNNRLLLYSDIIVDLRRCSFTLSVLFLILTMPQTCCNIVLMIFEKAKVDNIDLIIYFVLDITNTLKDVFLSFKILVYFVTLRTFRSQLKKVLCCVCSLSNRKPVRTVDNNSIRYT